SLLRNDLRPANKLAKGNRLFMRFATKAPGLGSIQD
ncbi:NCBP3 isoform 4, partial [Pan troglodytes]